MSKYITIEGYIKQNDSFSEYRKDYISKTLITCLIEDISLRQERYGTSISGFQKASDYYVYCRSQKCSMGITKTVYEELLAKLMEEDTQQEDNAETPCKSMEDSIAIYEATL